MQTLRKALPLEGVKVLELARLLPGPLTSHLLHLMGAEIIKVEDLHAGDYMRLMPPHATGVDGKPESTVFRMVNAGKRSIRVNLKCDGGQRIDRRLIEDVDIVLDSFRPGVMERLGLGNEELSNINPGLIQCSITGYGQHGPLSGKAGHDPSFTARVDCSLYPEL